MTEMCQAVGNAEKQAGNAVRDRMQDNKDRLYAFHQEILQNYMQIMSGDRNTLFRMKELWFYLGASFTNSDKYLKKIKKAERIALYQSVVDALFREQELLIE